MRWTVWTTLLLTSVAPAWAAAAPKNVLFLMSDDMRPALGCYGHPVVKSPNLDALARAGVRFDRVNCQYALCSPSRSSLPTGRHPTTTVVLDGTADFRIAHPGWVTLPEHFLIDDPKCAAVRAERATPTRRHVAGGAQR
jgi:iduronate 2-sulfatase